MTVYHKPTTVLVQRQQDEKPWIGTITHQVFHGVFKQDEKGNDIPGTEKPGEFIAFCVRDEKDFELFASPSQIKEYSDVA